MNRPHCFQYLGGSRWRSVQAVNFFLSREDSMVNSGYAGPSGCAVSSFSMKSCRAAPGSGCFIKFSPIRKPWNPAERSCRTMRGSERPLSEILTKRSGMRPPSSNERAGSVRKELRSRLLIPATSTSSQRCPSFLFVVDFEQYFQPERVRVSGQRPDVGRGQCRCDQQDDVGSGDPGFANLVRVDDKIFAQDRYR